MNIVYLIPYYNAYKDLILTLNSLVEGTDVLIVDDGSETPLTSLLDTNQYNFPITIIEAEQNVGIDRALNIGLCAIYQKKYTHVARIDCGDLCAPTRISTQRAYFKSDPDLILVGSWARFVDSQYQPLFISQMPVEHLDIQRQMFVNNMFIHPSVMMKVNVLESVEGYPINRPAAEDYALFYKMLAHGSCKNIPEPLIDYVVSDNSISSKKRTRQILSRMQVMCDHKRINWRWYYGLLRSVLLLITPRSVTTTLRKFIKVY